MQNKICWLPLFLVLQTACGNNQGSYQSPSSVLQSSNQAPTAQKDLQTIVEGNPETINESTVGSRDVIAVEPVAVGGAYFTCSMPTYDGKASDSYPVTCKSTVAAEDWKFFVVRNGGTPVEIPAITIDPKTWSFLPKLLANDASLSIIARYTLNGQTVDISAPLDSEAVRVRKNALIPTPSSIIGVKTSEFLLTTTINGTNSFLSVGELALDAFGAATTQTLNVTNAEAAAASTYRVRLDQTASGDLQFDILSPNSTVSQSNCLDVRGQVFQVGIELIRYPCKTLSFAQNQNFKALLEADNRSFKIQSSQSPNFCVGALPATSKLVLVACVDAFIFKLEPVIKPTI